MKVIPARCVSFSAKPGQLVRAVVTSSTKDTTGGNLGGRVATSLSTLDPATAKRLDAIRGSSPRRSPNVRVLADFSQNTDCRLATLGFAAGVDFGNLLRGTSFQSAFTHSPFAVTRGLSFENMLRENNYALTLDLVRGPLGLPAKGAHAVNLREGFPAGPGRMPARLKKTQDLMQQILRGETAAPHWLDGSVLRCGVGGIEAFFEADALGRGSVGPIRIVEVKSFPKVDDRIDPDQLGSALDQSALYVMLSREAIAQLGASGALGKRPGNADHTEKCRADTHAIGTASECTDYPNAASVGRHPQRRGRGNCDLD